MERSVLKKLREKNEFPILFVGSGISKRYLNDFPSWDELLEQFWEDSKISGDFYGRLNILRDELKNTEKNMKDKEVEFNSNIEMSSIIAKGYNTMFNKGEIDIEGFSTKEAYNSGIEPFKMGIKNKFNSYTVRPKMEDEVKKFKKALTKSQIMITTNYDSFIEDCYNSLSQYGIKTYIGQSGFFEETIGYAELYKIHGCISKPQSIVISKEDYRLFNENSILISSKIISMLIHSPIIFLGYSLTDQNVRKFIKDFASSLTNNDPVSIEERLIIIDWEENQNELVEEVIYDQDLNCKFTVIRTDNYEKVYEYISSIDQGVAPSEIRKYQHIIRQLVVDSGREGALRSVLLSPIELDKIEEMIKDGSILNEKVVVALGDSTVIFKIPNKLTYLEDYIFERNELTTDVVLRFLANEQTSGRYPFIKYVTEENINESKLHDYEKQKLKQRLENHSDLRIQMKSIPISYRIEESDLNQILTSDHVEDREYCLIAYNIERLNINEVEEYIKEKVTELVSVGENKINTHLRRLLLIFDLYKNKRSDA